MLTGQNGILNNATRAKQDTERQQIIETARVDILAKQTENQGSLSEEELVEILTSPDYNTKGTLSENNEESVQQKTLTSSDGKYTIPVLDIYGGRLNNSQNKMISFSFEWSLYDGDHTRSYQVTDGQTWYEWAQLTRNEPIPLYQLWGYDGSLQELIIEINDNPNWGSVVEKDGKRIIGYYDGTNHMEFFKTELEEYLGEFYPRSHEAVYSPTDEIVGDTTYSMSIWWED